MKMVELREISMRYGAVDALTRVNLEVNEGEFVTLLGPSGSGKSTLLNIIAGAVTPTSGQVFIRDKEVTNTHPGQRQLGMVFQNYALMPHMTVFENIAFPLRIRKVAKAEIEHRVNEVLKLVRLPDVLRRLPRELSGGQQQRVSLARCIVYNPALILLDEPLGALDKKLREQMQLEIRRVHFELGITMLNVTHDQDEALTMSNRIVLMKEGRIEQQATPEQLYFEPSTVFAADFIGSANLICGTVHSVSLDEVSIQTSFGLIQTSRVEQTAVVGADVTLLVRPEALEISAVTTLGAAGPNTIFGTLEDSIMHGSVVRHHVRTSDGQELVAQEHNLRARILFERGSPVRLSWLKENGNIVQ